MLNFTQRNEALHAKKKVSFWRWLLYGFVALLLFASFAFGALFLYLKENPEELSQKISKELQSRAGIEIVFSSINVALFPMPALSFSDVELTGKGFELDVAYATVTPSLALLFSGEFSLGKMTLWRPVLRLEMQSTSTEKTPLPAETNENALAMHKENVGEQLQEAINNLQIPSFLRRSSLQVMHGNFSLRHKEMLVQSENIQSTVAFKLLGDVRGEILFPTVHLVSDEKLVASMKDFSLTLSGDLDESVEIDVKSQVSVEKVIQKSNFQLALTYAKPPPNNQQELTAKPAGQGGALQSEFKSISGSWKAEVDFLTSDYVLAASSAGNFSGNLQNQIALSGASVKLGEDAVTFDATVNVQDMYNPVAQGTIDIAHFSLTRWFGFARQLPKGIRYSLHGLTGEIDFVMDKKGLDVPYLQASTANASLLGKGHVKDWANPVIYIDAATDLLELKNIYPEAESLQSAELVFEHEPLTPVPGSTPETEDDSSISVGYDVNIHSKKLIAWGMPLGDIDFRCVPTLLEKKPLPKNVQSAVTLALTTKSFYGGSGVVRAVLYGDPQQESADRQTVFAISLDLAKMQIIKPVARLMGRNLVSGTMNLDADFTTRGSSLSEMMLSKKGRASLRIENGMLYADDNRKNPFKTLNLSGDFTAKNPTKVRGDTMPSKFQYAGDWKASLSMPQFVAKGAWNGLLEFTGKNYGTVMLEKFLGSLDLQLATNTFSLSRPLDVSMRGTFSLDTGKDEVRLRNGTGNIPKFGDMDFSGNLFMDYTDDIEWSATLKAKTAELGSILKAFNAKGESFLPPTLPQAAQMQFSAKFDHKRLSIKDVSIKAEKMHLRGDVGYRATENSNWNFNLHLNELDYDTHLSEKSGLGYTHVRGLGPSGTPVYEAHTSSENDGRMSWQWLRGLNANGTIKIDLVRVKKLSVNNVSTNVTIQNSTLKLAPIKGTLYGGPLSASFTGTLKDGALDTHIKFDTKRVKLLDLTKDLHMETVFAGHTQVSLDLKGLLSNKNKVLSVFNGKWSVHVAEGFMQSSTTDGRLKGKPTRITSFSDSGTLNSGVLHSHNFKLLGPDMQIRGKGYLNLLQESLDMRLVADMGYIVDIPVRYYGTLDDPKRSLNTGAVVVAAIGSLGTGVFDLIGTIFSTIFGAVK